MTFVATIISGAYIYRYLPKDDQKMMGINKWLQILLIKNGRQSKGVLLLRTLAMPSDTNANGDIFGGWIMSQMDMGGAILAKENCPRPCRHRCS